MKAESPLGSANTNTRTIARNSFWNAVEYFFGMAVTVWTTILVARILGKDDASQARLGTYNYIVTLTSFTLAVGTLGLPATTRKYMAEYLNCGEPGVARAMYLATLKIQSAIALGVATLGVVGVFWLTAPQYFLPAMLLVAAMVPRLISYIPSSANSAAEVFRRNTVPGLAGAMVTAILTISGLLLGWEFVGLSAAVLAGSLLECVLKLRSVELWMGGIASVPVTAELRRRMFAYSGQGIALLVLNLVVWDRSDVIVLQAMNPDARQILFFSTAFSLAERVLLIPAMFGGSLTLTMMAQYGRGKARLKEMTVDGARYALLMAMPLLVGMACVSGPLVLLVYGQKYRLLIPTLAIVAITAIPKVLVSAPTMLLQTTERQGFLIWWGCLCGVVDVGLDILLTPRYGANGAALANGAAQMMAAIGMWAYIRKTDDIQLRLRDFGRIAVCGAVMALGVIAFLRVVPGNGGMFASVGLGAILWFLTLRLTGALRPEDASRFLSLGGQLPASVQPYWKRLINWLAPAAGVAES